MWALSDNVGVKRMLICLFTFQWARTWSDLTDAGLILKANLEMLGNVNPIKESKRTIE